MMLIHVETTSQSLDKALSEFDQMKKQAKRHSNLT